MPVKLTIRWQLLALWGLMLLGLALRLYGLNWDQGNNFHPDERQILFHVTALRWPASLAQFLDPASSSLNPHFFSYGSFPIYLLALLCHFFIPASDPNTFFACTLVGRVLSAIFDSMTILLTGWLALLLMRERDNSGALVPGRYGWSVALLAAALVTFAPLHLQLAHFYAVDSLLVTFVMLTLVACVVLVDTERPVRWLLLASLAYGLALATKFSAAPLAVPLLVALLLRGRRQRDMLSSLVYLFFIFAITGVVFFITQPYALLDLHSYVQQVAEQGSLARGALDLPYVRQFAGTIPFVYQAQNMLFWGMGVTAGLAAAAGLLWLLWRLWRRAAGNWPVVLSWVLVYGVITGSFYVKFMRYMLPIYPPLLLMGAAVVVALVTREWAWLRKFVPLPGCERILAVVRGMIVVLVLGGTIFQGLALLNVYSQPNTRVQASRWIYSHLPPGSVLTYEQWDDPLPVAVDGRSGAIYKQATYTGSDGQEQQGLDLYGDDTTDKARMLANMLPTVDAITMSSDRLDKSIPRLPYRYPLTIRYYQLLFSGQLGFHLAAQFENRPNLLGVTLDDSNADESYSVFDHPTVRIFVRDTPYPYTPDQLFHKLLDGVHLPPPGAGLSGAQRALMLSPQQIADNQSSPPFGVQFPARSLANSAPALFWWLALTLLGLLAYPLLFLPLRALADRGYLFGKIMGLLLLSYLSWMFAATHLLPFERFSVLVSLVLLLLCGTLALFLQRRTILAFMRQRWRLLLVLEGLFTLAFFLFVVVRAFNPDLWSPYRGGEKPMELAFLNAVLRSSYLPPLDPWFAGGYINYYYYGYFIFGAVIKLTGILPTTAFNLALPTLFAMTFSGAVIIVYTLSRSFPIALLGGYFSALIGNFDGFIQLKTQIFSLFARLPVPAFDYWRSSRVISPPFTINEFPFWSFLFADLHPHVIDLPITVCMLGVLAALLFSSFSSTRNEHIASTGLYLLAAFFFGTIACVNPWDMPVYAVLLVVVLLVRRLRRQAEAPVSPGSLLIALGWQVLLAAALYGAGYLFYLPFHVSYQQLYVNGLGIVKQGSSQADFLIVFGLWLFLALSFLLAELARSWSFSRSPLRTVLFVMSSILVMVVSLLLGIKFLLIALLALAVFVLVRLLFASASDNTSLVERRTPGGRLSSFGLDQGIERPGRGLEESGRPQGSLLLYTVPIRALWRGLRRSGSKKPPLVRERLSHALLFGMERDVITRNLYTTLLLLMGLGICLGIELVYVRDFLDGSDYARMNTVFKFSMQAWLCLAIGGALAVQRLWHVGGFWLRRAWRVVSVVLVCACSIFLVEGTAARVADHQLWAATQSPTGNSNYAPTLDGFAFVRAWYPGDAEAMSWLNEHVPGSPVILEAAMPVSYQWFGRVSVFTGLPSVLGWPDHVGEQRYSSQPLNRLTDINLIYTTTDKAQALELLHYYHVRYIYVGPLEREVYAAQSPEGLDKFNDLAGDSLRVVYSKNGVTIYEVL